MSSSTDLRHVVVSDSEGGLLQWSGKASVVELLSPGRRSTQFPDGGRIHIYASGRTPVTYVTGKALLGALQARHAVKKRSGFQLFVLREHSWSVLPSKSQSLADSLEKLTLDLHAADVLIDFSEINDRRLKKVERLVLEAYLPSAAEFWAPDPTVTIGDSEETASELVQLEQSAAARRSELADDWPTAATVSRAMGSTAGNASQLATRLRRAGELLAVYLPVPGGSWRFPRWQFRSDGQPVEHLKDILKVLREDGKFYDSQRRTTGWGEVEWFISGHVLLEGKSPSEALATHPKRVLEAARAEFREDA